MNQARKPIRPSQPPSRLLSAILGLAILGVAFATLMMRLAVVQEGYRLSRLRDEIASLQTSNRSLMIETAELSSHQRLRGLAVKYGLGPPARGQVVRLP